VVVCCFFFQAEDGIRDFHVTGVQTCALPISAIPRARFANGRSKRSEARGRPYRLRLRPGPGFPHATMIVRGRSSAGPSRWARTRSEERRVGKEGRSRRAPDRHNNEAETDEKT